MTKNEFMKELRTYLIYEQAAIRNEILADYETYFAMAAASGLTEEEMIAGLDTPSRIASTLYGRDAAVKPRRIGFHSLPSDLIHGVSHGLEKGLEKVRPLGRPLLSLLRRGSAFFFRWCGLLSAILLFLAALSGVGLLASGITILPSIPPLPVMSPLSLMLLAVSGISFSLFLSAFGRTLSDAILSDNPISFFKKED